MDKQEIDWDAHKEAIKAQPKEPLCEKVISVDVFAKRCVYLNEYRIAGGKPYVSENIPCKSFNITTRDALDAFSIEELEAYTKEKKARDKYWADYRANKVAAE